MMGGKTKSKSKTKTKTKTKTRTRAKTMRVQVKGKETQPLVLEKQLTETQFMKLEYPYRHIEISKQKMLEDFKSLKAFQPVVLNVNPTKARINKFSDKDERYVVFLENYNKYKHYYLLTDYFSHKCRVKCIFNLKEDKSILDLFQDNKKKILTYLKQRNQPITFYNINEYIWKHFRQCTNFNTTVVVSVIKYFAPSKVLDFSAGWGDRLMGAMACGVEYTGVDPSICMNSIYHRMIDTLVDKGEQKKYKIIQDGFENVTLKAKEYDLVFTSPPFFDMEIYENTETQSVERFKSVIKWKQGFLYPSIKKSFTYLKKGGHLALYITDFRDSSYIYDMKQYIKKNIKGFKYKGDLHWWDQHNPKTVRKIFVWKKRF